MQLMRSTLLIRSTLVAALLAVAVLSACDKNTVKPTPRTVPIYPILGTPQEVLTALQLAYARRDSVEYKALHDSSYVGTSTDDLDPPGTPPLQFTFADEAAHIAALARRSSISRVRLELGPASSWNRLPSDDVAHPEWAMIQIPGMNFEVEITDGFDSYTAGGQLEFIHFAFKPTTPDSTSPTDTTWKIVRWTENRSF
jgi:hypothetical protein